MKQKIIPALVALAFASQAQAVVLTSDPGTIAPSSSEVVNGGQVYQQNLDNTNQFLSQGAAIIDAANVASAAASAAATADTKAGTAQTTANNVYNELVTVEATVSDVNNTALTAQSTATNASNLSNINASDIANLSATITAQSSTISTVQSDVATATSNANDALTQANQLTSSVTTANDNASYAVTQANNAFSGITTATDLANQAGNLSNQNATDITNISTQINAQGNDIAVNAQAITTTQNDVATLNTHVNTIDGQITTIQADTATALSTANQANTTANTSQAGVNHINSALNITASSVNLHNQAGSTSSSLDLGQAGLSLMVTNSIGNAHGLQVDQGGTHQTVLSGGTHSTSLTLDDNGATLKNVTTGGDAQLHGVANGSANNDAVNLGQLNQAISNVSVDPTVNTRLTANEAAIKDTNARMQEIAHKAFAGAALAMSMANATAPNGEAGFAIGTAYFNGETAVSVSAIMPINLADATVKVSFGVTSQADIGFAGSVFIPWNPTVSYKPANVIISENMKAGE